MDKNISIVLSQTSSNYRKVAQKNWGLTDEQMKDMDVHHFPPVSEGGRNIPEHLYVCSPYVHSYWWHNEKQFVMWARRGAQKAHEKKTTDGKSELAVKSGKAVHIELLPDGRSKNAVYASRCAQKAFHQDPVKWKRRNDIILAVSQKLHNEKNEDGKSVFATKIGKIPHQEKYDDGRSIHAVRIAKLSHQNTDELGRSVKVMDMNEKVHSEKDGYGRSLHTVNYLLKYNEPRKKQIRVTHIENEEVFIFNSLGEAARALKVHKTGLSQVALKKSKQHKGYYAEYF